MSERVCGDCGLPMTGKPEILGGLDGETPVHAHASDCIGPLRAALAAATARAGKPLTEGPETVEALLDYIQSAGVEQPDPIRQRLHAALAAHTERVVRETVEWCWFHDRHGNPIPNDPLPEDVLARALAAAKGGQDGVA